MDDDQRNTESNIEKNSSQQPGIDKGNKNNGSSANSIGVAKAGASATTSSLKEDQEEHVPLHQQNSSTGDNPPCQEIIVTDGKGKDEMQAKEDPRSQPSEEIDRFPEKLMRILDTQEYDEIFSWNRKGNAIVIHKPSDLIGEVLTKHFDAKEGMKFDSFLRKLYRWGFAKHVISEGERGGDEGEHIYAHSNFRKGEYDSCSKMFCASKPATGRAAYSSSSRNTSTNPSTTSSSNTESSQNLGVGFMQQSGAFNTNPILNIPAQQFGGNRTTAAYMQLLQRSQHNPSPPAASSLAANMMQQQTRQQLPNMNPQNHHATLNQNQPQVNPNMSSILPILSAGSNMSLPQHQQNPMISQGFISRIQQENNLLFQLANLQQSYLQQTYANMITGQANAHSVHNNPISAGQPSSMPPHIQQQSTASKAGTMQNTTNASSNPSGIFLPESSNHMIQRQLPHGLQQRAQATESLGQTIGGSPAESDSKTVYSNNNTPSGIGAEETHMHNGSTNNDPNNNNSSVSQEMNVVPSVLEDPEGLIGKQQQEEENKNPLTTANAQLGQEVSSRRDESRMNPSDSDTEQLAQRRRLN